VGARARACACTRVGLLIPYATPRRLLFATSLAPYFSTFSHKRQNFCKNVTERRMCYVFVCNSYLRCFSFSRRLQQDIILNVKTFSRKVPLFFFWILIKFEFFRHIFEKVSNIKFHQNPSSGSRVAPCRKTDGRAGWHDGANSCFSQFCERA
jgi:hypothetical protein